MTIGSGLLAASINVARLGKGGSQPEAARKG